MVGTEKSASFLDFMFHLIMIPSKGKNATKFFIIVSKTDCSNEKSLAIRVKCM